MADNQSLGPIEIFEASTRAINEALRVIVERLDALQGLRGRVTLHDRVGVSAPTQSTDAINLGYLANILATAVPPEVETAGAIGTSTTKFAREDHTHSGVNLSDTQTIGGAKTFTLKVTCSDELQIGGALNHDGLTVGFYGVAPTARAAAYTITNVTPDRAYNANATTIDEIADVLGTVIADLQAVGLLQ